MTDTDTYEAPVGVPVIKAKWQVMPPPTLAEYQALDKSIFEHGVKVAVLEDENGDVLDGHYRDEIATRRRIACERTRLTGLTEDEKVGMAISLNLHRRHLNSEQKRDAIAKYIALQPTASNSKIAKDLGVDDHTVDSVRQRDQNSENPKVEHKPVERAKAYLRGLRHGPRSMLFRDVAEAVNVSPATVSKACKEIEAEDAEKASAKKAPAKKAAPKLTVVKDQPKPTAKQITVNEIGVYITDLAATVKRLRRHTLTLDDAKVLLSQRTRLEDVVDDLKSQISKVTTAAHCTPAASFSLPLDGTLCEDTPVPGYKEPEDGKRHE